MSAPDDHPARTHLRSRLDDELFAPAQWKRRFALWGGGVLVGLAAIAFARASDYAFVGFRAILAISAWLPLAIMPAAFALLAWLTSGPLKATRGSGIPQVIAALDVPEAAFRDRLLSLPVVLAKMALTLFGLAMGASIGREGPTVHVGAGIMYSIGKRLGFADPKALSRFILAGGGAGIAAAFNTPLAGVVFAIEELAGTFEHRFSGIILTAVIFAGIVSLGVLGNYAYFGRVAAEMPLGQSWFAVALCGLCGGLGGALFARTILLQEPDPASRNPLTRVAAMRARWPVGFAAGCGLALAVLGVVSAHFGSGIYGTGYAEARDLVQSTHGAAFVFGWLKLAANVLSYWAGIPGGIFSPALAVGAGMGNAVSSLLPQADKAAIVLVGMGAFLSGVTQAPLTSAVITLELTANQSMVIPILAVCLLARAIAALIAPVPVYRAFAQRLIDEHERQQAADAVPVHAPDPMPATAPATSAPK
ncbi:MAG: chloride channel protein [Proteobacteria bacterium]|nr:chloride channel protein [Pseudomonadota bacterium]